MLALPSPRAYTSLRLSSLSAALPAADECSSTVILTYIMHTDIVSTLQLFLISFSCRSLWLGKGHMSLCSMAS